MVVVEAQPAVACNVSMERWKEGFFIQPGKAGDEQVRQET